LIQRYRNGLHLLLLLLPAGASWHSCITPAALSVTHSTQHLMITLLLLLLPAESGTHRCSLL
jgi:hypothetical protein